MKDTKISNKQKGHNFEEDFANYLSEQGWWVTTFPGKAYSNSQPADLIACRYNIGALIDCKTLENKTGTFPIDRIEDNQRKCWKRFRECENAIYFLAILYNNNVYTIRLKDIDLSKKSFNISDCELFKENFYEDISE